jgi:hypothetical protein
MPTLKKSAIAFFRNVVLSGPKASRHQHDINGTGEGFLERPLNIGEFVADRTYADYSGAVEI